LRVSDVGVRKENRIYIAVYLSLPWWRERLPVVEEGSCLGLAMDMDLLGCLFIVDMDTWLMIMDGRS